MRRSHAQSIRHLCALDHGNRRDILKDWLANKTPETVGSWIADKNSIFLAAERQGRIIAVGSAKHSGEITLNYVDPSARFSGVSSALLAQLEARLAALGLSEVNLTSTNTAREFYLKRGYGPAGPAKPWWGETMVHPMVKVLPPKH